MNKEKKIIKVLEYMEITGRLLNTIRAGWLNWNISRERVESVAEHVYETVNLAIGMYSEFDYDIKLEKVIYMLGIHELGEAVIGDIPVVEQKYDKVATERLAVVKILNDLISGSEILALWDEFENKETKEATFAFYCDKAVCDIRSKIYDNEGCFNLKLPKNIEYIDKLGVEDMLKKEGSLSNMWIEFGLNKYNYDENFSALLKYVKTKGIPQKKIILLN